MSSITEIGSFSDFATAKMAECGLAPALHHQLIISELEKLAAGDTNRLMILMPPGTGKSTYVASLFPAWLLLSNQSDKILGASSTNRVSQHIRDRVSGYCGNGAFPSDRYMPVGVGSAVLGWLADFGIIDDLDQCGGDVSRFERDRRWNWYVSDFAPRVKRDGKIAIVASRRYADDICGRILASQQNVWTVIRLPAFAVSDPLGRRSGEALWADYPDGEYEKHAREAIAAMNGSGRWTYQQGIA